MDTQKKAVLLIHAAREALSKRMLIVLERQINYSNSTAGQLLVNGETFDTIELPWLENRINVSRIPEGTYTFQKIKRSSNGKNALYIRGVKGRSEILIHVGRKPDDSQGCVLVPNYEEFHEAVADKGILVVI
jgi:hypothetical protein